MCSGILPICRRGSGFPVSGRSYWVSDEPPLLQCPGREPQHGKIDAAARDVRGYPGTKKHPIPFREPGDIGTSMGTRTPVFAVRGRRLNRLTMEACVAAELGFEPRQHESESWVLPLHNSAIVNRTRRARPTNSIIRNSTPFVNRFFQLFFFLTFSSVRSCVNFFAPRVYFPAEMCYPAGRNQFMPEVRVR